jgi:phenylpropionate dioxygenase-like ring-hydroxylating dioxygenase large terminal subunit
VPTEPFVSAAWHDREVAGLWRKVWQVACREERIPNVGDHVVYEIAQDSLIITRTAPDKIQAFYNACLHRGRKLRDDGGSVKSFRCPFHGFTWNLDGSLREIPCQWDFGHVEPEKFCLPEARVATWGGFVFICMDDETEGFEDFIGPLADHFRDFPLENRYIAAHVAKVIPCNWKIGLEAFIESYHVIATHPQGLLYIGDSNTQYDNFGGRYNWTRMIVPHGIASPHLGDDVDEADIIDNAKSMLGQDAEEEFRSGLSARQALAEHERKTLQARTGVDLSNVSDSEIIDTIQYHVFPNFVPWGDYGAPLIYLYRPNGDDHTTSIMEVYLLLPFPPGERPAPAPMRHLTIDEPWDTAPEIPTGLSNIFNQDLSNMHAVQQGLRTTRKPGMTLGNYQESRIRHFHRLYERQLDRMDGEQR